MSACSILEEVEVPRHDPQDQSYRPVNIHGESTVHIVSHKVTDHVPLIQELRRCCISVDGFVLAIRYSGNDILKLDSD